MPGDRPADLRALYALVDDGGLFPLGAREAEDVVARHRGDREKAHPMLTHRLLCPSSRLPEVLRASRPGDAFHVILIIDEGIDALAPAVADVSAAATLELTGVEFPVYAAKAEDTPAALAEALGGLEGARVPFEVALAILPSHVRQTGDLAIAIAERDHPRPVGVKLWCGTDTNGRYPSAADLAGALCAVARVGGEARAAAGLHYTAVRQPNDEGSGPHGFLNLLLAAAGAATGAERFAVTETLNLTDPAVLVERLRNLDETQVRASRRLLTSFGAADSHAPLTLADDLGLFAPSGPTQDPTHDLGRGETR